MDWFHSHAQWYVLGFGGQLPFGSRFVVQWWPRSAPGTS